MNATFGLVKTLFLFLTKDALTLLDATRNTEAFPHLKTIKYVNTSLEYMYFIRKVLVWKNIGWYIPVLFIMGKDC